MNFELPFLEEAIRIAVRNVRSGEGGPFGALVVKGESVIGRGTNLVTSVNDPTAHAEINAIREACAALGTFRLEGCVLYASCEPCPMCLGAVYWARLRHVVYAATRDDASRAGFDDAFFYRELSAAPEERSIPMRRHDVDSALRPFEEWLSRPDRIDY